MIRINLKIYRMRNFMDKIYLIQKSIIKTTTEKKGELYEMCTVLNEQK